MGRMLWRDDIPKDLRAPVGTRENICWRAAMLDRCDKDSGYRSMVMELCSRSQSFFFDAFLYTKNQRQIHMPEVPFVLYDFQEDLLLREWQKRLTESAARHRMDLGHLKSRDMGLSWTFSGWALWNWRFTQGFEALLGNRNQDYVDSKTLKSHFGKLRYHIGNLPWWMLPDGFDSTQGGQHISKNVILNPENGSVLEGEPTSPDFGSGGRYSVVFMDELSKLPDAEESWTSVDQCTNFRLTVFTPKGVNNFAYDLHEQGQVQFINIGWWLHPVKSLGLYRNVGGKLEILDESYDFPDDYLFQEGEKRSPWYDTECASNSPQHVAQEIDMAFLGSGVSVFDIGRCKDMRTQVTQDIQKGEYGVRYDIVYSPEKALGERVVFTPSAEQPTAAQLIDLHFGPKHPGEVGYLRIFEDPVLYEGDGDCIEFQNRYEMAIDLAEGLEDGDRSVIDIYDKMTNTQVAQLMALIDPDILGEYGFKLWEMYGKPNIIIETNHGHAFTTIKTMRGLIGHESLRYFYMSRTHGRRHEHKTDRIGWYASGSKGDNQGTKALVINRLKSYIREVLFTVRSAMTVQELLHYEEKVKKSTGSTYMGSSGSWHDDCVITLALSLEGAEKSPGVLRKNNTSVKKELDIHQIALLQSSRNARLNSWLLG